MARYFFHLHQRGETLRDEEGRDLPGIHVIAGAALREARGIIRHDAGEGRLTLGARIDVEDERHVRVHTIVFADAVTIEP